MGQKKEWQTPLLAIPYPYKEVYYLPTTFLPLTIILITHHHLTITASASPWG